MKHLFLIVILGLSITVNAQLQSDDVYNLSSHMSKLNIRNEIRLPIVDGLLPLKCDFHTHTIFSDGHVMPSLRVIEAWQQGLDVVAITDHIEYRPNKDILKGDLDRKSVV